MDNNSLGEKVKTLCLGFSRWVRKGLDDLFQIGSETTKPEDKEDKKEYEPTSKPAEDANQEIVSVKIDIVEPEPDSKTAKTEKKPTVKKTATKQKPKKPTIPKSKTAKSKTTKSKTTKSKTVKPKTTKQTKPDSSTNPDFSKSSVAASKFQSYFFSRQDAKIAKVFLFN